MVVEIVNGELAGNAWDVDWRDIQEFVGGRFRTVPVPRPVPALDVVGCVNEDALDLPPNCEIPGVGVVRGPLMIVGVDGTGAVRPLDRQEWTAYQLVDRPGRPVPLLTVSRSGDIGA